MGLNFICYALWCDSCLYLTERPSEIADDDELLPGLNRLLGKCCFGPLLYVIVNCIMYKYNIENIL